MKEIRPELSPEEGTPMWELFKRKDTVLVAAGSIPCIRELYILAKMKHKLNHLYYVHCSDEDYIMGTAEDKIRVAARNASETKGARVLILYLSCPDVLIRIDFDDLERSLTKELGVPVICFYRGPLAKEDTRYRPIETFMAALPKEEGEISGSPMELMPPVADMAGVSDWMRLPGNGNIILTPSGCRSCMADADMEEGQEDVYYTEIQKDDVIFGIDESTEKQTSSLMEEKKLRSFSLIGTAVPSFIGVNDKAILKEEAEKGHWGLYFPTDGFHDAIYGVAEAEKILLRSRMGTWRGKSSGTVEIFGYSPLLSGDIHQFDSCVDFLKAEGLTVRFAGRDDIPEEPALSWVVSSAGIPAAEFLAKTKGTPMVLADPLGHHAMESWKKNVKDLLYGKDRVRMLKIHNMALPKTRKTKVLFLGEPMQIMAAAHYMRHAGFYRLKLLTYAWDSLDRLIYEKAPGGKEWFTAITKKEELSPYWEEADLVVADDAFLEIMGDKPHISLNTGLFSGRGAAISGSGVLGETFRKAVDDHIR